MAEKIRIKDIAEKSGVSVGTVDRILHNRPNVSAKAREKVEQVLKEINYEPNRYASALASNKKCDFIILMPRFEKGSYWEEIYDGAQACMKARVDFNINVCCKFYERFDTKSFEKAGKEVLDCRPDGVVLVPSTLEVTKNMTDVLHNRNTPFVLLDSYMPDLKPLTFFGQDSFQSGYFAAKMLMLLAGKEKEIMMMKQTKDGIIASKQQDNREVGFRHYMHDHFPQIKIHNIDLPLYDDVDAYDNKLDEFFDKHPHVNYCITMSSKAHIVGEYLLRTNKREKQMMGYDMTPRNAECLRNGSICFLIAQHAYMQGYSCIESLFRAVVLHKEVMPVNYVPLEILSKENMDFYRSKL